MRPPLPKKLEMRTAWNRGGPTRNNSNTFNLSETWITGPQVVSSNFQRFQRKLPKGQFELEHPSCKLLRRNLSESYLSRLYFSYLHPSPRGFDHTSVRSSYFITARCKSEGVEKRTRTHTTESPADPLPPCFSSHLVEPPTPYLSPTWRNSALWSSG